MRADVVLRARGWAIYASNYASINAYDGCGSGVPSKLIASIDLRRYGRLSGWWWCDEISILVFTLHIVRPIRSIRLCLLKSPLTIDLPKSIHLSNMTADASVYAPLTNAAYRAPAVKQPAMTPSITTCKKPWRETPLVESANLSEAAGWYGAHSFLVSRPNGTIHMAMHQ